MPYKLKKNECWMKHGPNVCPKGSVCQWGPVRPKCPCKGKHIGTVCCVGQCKKKRGRRQTKGPTVKQLQAECKKLGIPYSGKRKAELMRLCRKTSHTVHRQKPQRQRKKTNN